MKQDAGKRYSRKRDEILRVFRSAKSHPSARWVYEQLKPRFPRLSLGTVYRNIKSFREDGDLAFVGVVQGEERFDGRVEPHPHLVCFRCGRIVDIGGDWSETLRSFPDSEGTELESGFSIDHRRTVFYGLCGDCRETVDDGANTAGP